MKRIVKGSPLLARERENGAVPPGRSTSKSDRSTSSGWSRAEGQVATREFLVDLFEDGRNGFIALTRANVTLGERGTYPWDNVENRFGRYPVDLDGLVAWAMDAVEDGFDVYVCPMLRTRRERTSKTGAGGRWAWVDVDDSWNEQQRDRLRRAGGAVKAIESGSEGHYHVYVRVDSWLEPGEMERCNQALMRALGRDAKWSNADLLRLAGTLNFKPTLHGGAPTQVREVLL